MPKTVIRPEEAKQGRSGLRILIVLVGGLALAMLVWWGVEMFGRSIAPDDPVGETPLEEPATPAPQ